MTCSRESLVSMNLDIGILLCQEYVNTKVLQKCVEMRQEWADLVPNRVANPGLGQG